MNYLNENDPLVAEWLRGLIAGGALPPGVVDERSIEDVRPSDLAGYNQCHFFAGIGGWPLAFALAGIPTDWPAWTGSCPCQPLSAAGKGEGFTDERHIWPSWHWLIEQRRPVRVFGEQVDSPLGRDWIDLVSTDLEGYGYRVGSAVFPAAGVGSPQARHRRYFVADTLAGAREGGRRWIEDRQRRVNDWTPAGWNKNECQPQSGRAREPLAGADDGGLQAGEQRELSRAPFRYEGGATLELRGAFGSDDGRGPTNGYWRRADWLRCRDELWRPVEPGTFPLVDGIPGRVAALRGYGNAIVPAQAKAFIEAYLDCLTEEELGV